MNLRQQVRYRAQELTAYAHCVKARNKANKGKRFILIARERTGSNLLIDLLNSHPDINCMREGKVFFNRKRVLYPRSYLEGLAAQSKQQVFGAKVRIKHLLVQNLDPHKTLSKFVSDGWKLIYLHRLDHFARSVSFLVAKQREVWHQHSTERGEPFQVHLDPKQLIKQIGRNIHRTKIEQSVITQFPHLNLEYERDLRQDSNKQTTSERTFKFLDLPPHQVVTSFKKIVPSDLSQVITNYGDVVTEIAKSPYAEYLPTI